MERREEMPEAIVIITAPLEWIFFAFFLPRSLALLRLAVIRFAMTEDDNWVRWMRERPNGASTTLIVNA